MKLSDHKKGLAWLAGLVIAGGTLVQSWDNIADFADRHGWITRDQYREEHGEGRSALTLLEQVLIRVDKFETTWNCDELDEELPGLRRWRDRAEPQSDNWYKAD